VKVDEDRPRARKVIAEDGTEAEYDRLPAGDRLQPVHPAGAGQGPARA
jgi:hypothetical protein